LILKFRENTTFLFGKIKYSNKPIFDLDKIESHDYLREYLSQKLNLLAPTSYIQPPRKGTVLGHIKETIRFNDVLFTSNVGDNFKNLLDYISFGFGEKGYYYDIHLINQEIEIERFKEDIQDLIKLVNKMELDFENELIDLYYIENFEDKKRKMFEISNFQATIVDEYFLVKNFALLNSILHIIDDKSDIIVEEGENFSLPEVKFKLRNDSIFDSFDLFRENVKPLYDQRFFQIKKLLTKEELWSISSRGIPLKSVINIISLLK